MVGSCMESRTRKVVGEYRKLTMYDRGIVNAAIEKIAEHNSVLSLLTGRWWKGETLSHEDRANYYHSKLILQQNMQIKSNYVELNSGSMYAYHYHKKISESNTK